MQSKRLIPVLILFLPLLVLFTWFLPLYPLVAKPGLSLASKIYLLGQASGFLGITLFSQTLILNTRLKILEDIFGGLNKVFPWHHNLGKIAGIFILLHPGCLFISELIAGSSLEQILTGRLHLLSYLVGITAFLIFAFLIFLTLALKLPYHIWRFSHQFLGLSFLLAAYHLLNLGSDIAVNQPLKILMLFVVGLGITAYSYKTIFGHFLVKKYKYRLLDKKELSSDIIEYILESDGKPLTYQPGQFVFIKTDKQFWYEEQHPFSLTSTPEKKQISLVIKGLGDFTSKLKTIKPGTKFYLEGPYGRFLISNFGSSQIWIAGGIGITPFLSFLSQVNAKSKVTLIYSVSQAKEAVYLNFLKRKKDILFQLWLTQDRGRLSGEKIASVYPVFESDIYLCGPLTMIKSLRASFIKLGVDPSRIKSEEFKLVP